ncbi:MAG: DUF4271 domain-containing protein [Adhaeribacter sp.]
MFTGLKERKLLLKIKLAIRLSGLLFLFLSSLNLFGQAKLPPVKFSYTNQLNSDWLIYQPQTNQFSLYIPEYHGQVGALYQWVNIRPDKPFRINFTAKKDLCIFLNNKLIFAADSAATYALDLAELVVNNKLGQAQTSRYLLCLWHPTEQPNLSTFRNEGDIKISATSPQQKNTIVNQYRSSLNYNAFIIFLLLIGLIYGWLRTTYTSDFRSLFSLSNFLRRSALEEGFLAKPISSWSSVIFIIAFALSFALIIVAIHTNIQNIVIFNRLFSVSEADITSKILFYTLLIFSFILFKYLFLSVMGYTFDLTALVSLQYREFIRTLLFFGMFLPLIMVLYLALNTTMPQTVLLISTLAVSGILIITVLRIFYTLNKKVSLRNLHLFSYICATEIIPLIILLKLIVFNY